ncbi:MAG: hypothetical protein AAF152_15570 [Cyanobacteria bacterium P01_A01_bin.114]
MLDSSLLEWLRQFDLSMLGDLSELDWTDIATYGALALAVGSGIWASSKNLLRFLWRKTEGILGFAISTFVVFSLWYSLLRVHVSISFNLDKEIFDNCLLLSAVLFTPYYLIHYNLLKGFFLAVLRSVELTIDLLIFSWFPQKAEQNREKWRTRVSRLSKAWKNGLENFFQKGIEAAQASQLPFGLNSPKSSEAEVSEPTVSDNSVDLGHDGIL